MWLSRIGLCQSRNSTETIAVAHSGQSGSLVRGRTTRAAANATTASHVNGWCGWKNEVSSCSLAEMEPPTRRAATW